MAAKRKRYDTDRLLADADMKTVALEIGMKVNQTTSSSKNIGILCPNPKHPDRHFGNCIIRPDNTYTCFSCGDGGNVFRLVMQFLGVTYLESLGIVADICGGKKYYLTDCDEDNAGFRRILTREEGELIGIHNSAVYGIVGAQTDTGTTEPGLRSRLVSWTPDDEPIYVIEKCIDPNPLLTLMREDYPVYQEMILQKTYEVIDDRKDAIRCMADLQGGELFVPLYCSEIEQAENLLLKHFPEVPGVQRIIQQACAREGQVALVASALAIKEISSPF